MDDRLFGVPDDDGLSSSMQPHAIARRWAGTGCRRVQVPAGR